MSRAIAPERRTSLDVSGKDNAGQGIEYDRFLDCIHCGLCLSVCPTYEVLSTEMDSPRGRIYLMRTVTDGRLAVDDAVRKHLDLCLNCRACETACPSGVKYHQILEPFREGLAERLPTPPFPWLQRLAMARIFPYRGRVRFALAPLRIIQRLGLGGLLRSIAGRLPKTVRAMYETLPELAPHNGSLPELLPAEGPRRARVALFLGCIADGVYPQTNLATARVLQRNGCEVWIPRSQGCCGALDYHSVKMSRAEAFARANLEAFGFGRATIPEPDAIITNAAGCGAMLKDYGHIYRETELADAARKFAAKIRDISEFLIELGLVKPTNPVRMKATYHDACHLRHAQHIYQEPRKLLAAIPGLELVPLVESELCCGAAGSYNLTQPEMSDLLGQRKANCILATGADAVITGNVGCLLQITKHLRKAKPNLQVLHPVDVLWRAYGGGGP
jgi:glycolate oxidase iron-sulfur subunit